MKKRQQQIVLIIILLSAVAVRIVVALYYSNWVPSDQDDNSYSQLALQLATGQGYSFDQTWYPFTPADTPTSHWSFLYTAFVGAIYGLAGYQPVMVRLAGAVLGGLLLPYMVYRLTKRLFPNGEQLPLLAAACSVVYGFFILYAARIMTETYYIIALLWSLERAITLTLTWGNQTKPRWNIAVTLGVSLGLATLLRQSVLPWVAILFCWLLFVGFRKNHLGKAIAAVSLTSLVMSLFILPFTIRNYLAYDDFLLLNSNAGYAMYSAQHPIHGVSFQEHAAAPLPEELLPVDSMTEAQWDRELMRRGVGFVLDDPGRYLLLSASRVLDYFEFWPTDTSLLHNIGRLISFTLFAPFMVTGLVIAVRREKANRSWQAFLSTPVALALLFIVFYSLLHIFTWAMPRYRLPVDAVALPFAALAITEVWAAIQNRFSFRLPKRLRI